MLLVLNRWYKWNSVKYLPVVFHATRNFLSVMVNRPYSVTDNKSISTTDPSIFSLAEYIHQYSTLFANADSRPATLINTARSTADNNYFFSDRKFASSWRLSCTDEYILVRQSWWGSRRVDYIVYCPESLMRQPAHVLPIVFHSSYWESRDVMAFILRNVSSPSSGRHLWSIWTDNTSSGSTPILQWSNQEQSHFVCSYEVNRTLDTSIHIGENSRTSELFSSSDDTMIFCRISEQIIEPMMWWWWMLDHKLSSESSTTGQSIWCVWPMKKWTSMWWDPPLMVNGHCWIRWRPIHTVEYDIPFQKQRNWQSVCIPSS